MEHDDGDEKDDETSGGKNDDATKLKWKKMMPNSGIQKNPKKKIKTRGGKTYVRGAKSKIGKEPGKMRTVSSQLPLEIYFGPEARGIPLGIHNSNDIKKKK